MRTLLSVSTRKWLLSTGLQRMAGSWMTTAAALILPLSWNVMSAAWMKLKFRSSCPDIISGRPQAARRLRCKRSCRENSAARCRPWRGCDSDSSGKTALSTDKLFILNNLSGKYPLSPDILFLMWPPKFGLFITLDLLKIVFFVELQCKDTYFRD